MGDGGTQTPARTTVPQIQLVLYRHLITSGQPTTRPPFRLWVPELYSDGGWRSASNRRSASGPFCLLGAVMQLANRVLHLRASGQKRTGRRKERTEDRGEGG